MTRRLLFGLTIFVTCSIIWADNLQAETLYTKKSGVKMTQDSSPKSKLVAKLEKGVAVNVLEKRGRYFRVRLPNRSSGWIYSYKLSNQAPKKTGGDNSADLLASLGGDSTVSVHESSSGSSIRGLQATSKAYARQKQIDSDHIKALEWMEQFTVSDKDLLKFQQEGKTGEFSGERL